MKRLAAVLTSTLLTIGLLVAPVPSSARAAPRDIDNFSLDSVRDAYLTWLWPALNAPRTWDGDPGKCVSGAPQAQPAVAVGTYSPQGQAATLQAVNYFREMAGLQPVTEYAPGSGLAGQAALIMKANNTLTHQPTADMKCYSAAGLTGASTSNLSLGRPSGAHAVSLGFVDDPGANNALVGHRRWVLYPPLSGVGIGSTDRTTSLVVFGSGAVSANARPNGATAWPSAGYVPWEVMPISARWSYAPAGASLPASATVAMKKNGAAWPVQLTVSNELYGDPALVWQSGEITAPAVGAVDTYDVTIGGLPGGPVTYQVKTFRAAVARVGSVTVAGDPSVGTTLTATAHDPQPANAAVSYAWYADGAQVGNARTYRVAAGDVGKQLVARATATSPDGWASSTTNSGALTVKPGTLTPTGVGIEGKPVVGDTLRFVEGSWGAGVQVTFTRQWLRNGAAIPGAAGAQYSLTASDQGAKISLRVTGSAPGYTAKTVTTAELGPVTAAPTTPTPKPTPTPTTPKPTPTPTTPTTPPTPPAKFTKVPTPTVSGTAQVGKTLTAKAGTWSPVPTSLGYQWYRSGKAIAAATGRSYTLEPATKGGTITVRVTAQRTGYVTTTSKASKATKKVKAGTITAVKPKISGTVRVDSTLTAVPGAWKPAATTFTYQWYRNGSKIKGATKVAYVLKASDKGKKISVKVTGRAAGYTTKAKTSSKTAKVRARA